MSASIKVIDTLQFAAQLRARAIDVGARRILISRLSGSGQEADITAPVNCNGHGRVRHFKLATAQGWPSNPLPIVPACRALGIDAPEMMLAQVFQNAACPWRCWYCFVPEELLSADESRASWLTAEEITDLYVAETDRPLVIDLSGGSPDLVPEWTPWMMRALRDRGLENSTYLWGDDNLSTTYLFDKLERADLDLVRAYKNYGRVCCFKGFDERSFVFNTRARGDGFEQQFAIMRRVLDLGLDVYGYVTLTSPFDDHVDTGVADLVDRLQALDENLPLRVVPLRIQVYTPVTKRLFSDGEREKSMVIQETAIAAWNREINARFDAALRSTDIVDVQLKTRGVP
ncbi:MAG: radical SAM protein [Hyphomonadaceae bacterium]